MNAGPLSGQIIWKADWSGQGILKYVLVPQDQKVRTSWVTLTSLSFNYLTI